jgi:hypothetical protein
MDGLSSSTKRHVHVHRGAPHGQWCDKGREASAGAAAAGMLGAQQACSRDVCYAVCSA